MNCRKRGYSSRDQAKRANRKASFRLSVYWCGRCRSYHVTNRQKRMDSRSPNRRAGRRYRKRAYT